MSSKVKIRKIPSTVPGLDMILGGGIPEYSFNVILGPPGSGKTTLAHQIMFGLATPERPALFFSVPGEPPLKMMRYQQQFSFFDVDRLNTSIRFVSLTDDMVSGSLVQILASIQKEVEQFSPALVIIDSFRGIIREKRDGPNRAVNTPEFIQKLAFNLSSYQVTSFVIVEGTSGDDDDSIFAIADGLLAVHQNTVRNSMVRQIQVLKMRGNDTGPGLHAFRITNTGVEIFAIPRIVEETPVPAVEPRVQNRVRLTMGVPLLDDMLGGGLPAGYSLLVAGPSGSGKTILATQFLAEGVGIGEPGVVVAFEQAPNQSWTRTIDDMARAGKIGLIDTRAADLSMDEIIQRLAALIHKMKARRIVIDSLSGFELAVAPTFREDFRESLFRMVAVLAGLGVTVVMTSELEDRYTDLRFSPYGSAFLTDAIIVQRYIEVESTIKRVMAVVKVRASPHSNEIRQYEITDKGIVIGQVLDQYEGLLGGRPTRSMISPPVPAKGRQ